MKFTALASMLSLTLLASHSSADEYMELTRSDPHVPAHCQNVKVAQFSAAQKFFVYGITGAVREGFQYEIDLSRGEATQLWSALKGNLSAPEFLSQVRTDRRNLLANYFDFLTTEGEEMGFDYGKEGDLLEGLALRDLAREYPDSEYFRYGGVEYHEPGSATMGELDLLVARKSDCAVVAIGEAKLGTGQLSHAKSQLSRIFQFLRNKLCERPSSATPVCTVRIR
ncbi:MAG: hypothetical protein EOP09_04545 [Proteobacteria bacterium]|nr:MAG: hypothetical protein EOP09_04545 [Pseudomonadota bacterium]